MFQFDLKRNVTIGKGAIRNLLDGTSCASVKHYVETATKIMGADTECYDSVKDYFNLYHSKPGINILINSQEYWLGQEKDSAGSRSYFDTIMVDGNGTIRLYNYGDSLYDNTDSQKTICTTHRKRANIIDAVLNRGVEGLLELLSDTPKLKVFVPDDGETESITITAIDTDGNIYHPSHSVGKYGNWDFGRHVALPNETVVVTKTENLKTGEVKMNNVKNTATAVIAANKSSAVNAAKIEAGTIVINRAVKLLKPKMPFGTAGMLDSPVGRVALANVVNILVEQYASNNPKAKVISGAVMDAAMLQMVQSFNIGALVDDLISGVDISGFTEINETVTTAHELDINKYSK